ncbi:MAG: hypothetical protein Q9M97_10330 [Candidatus Gracilibacteria bacterium]|nr:hypothetical protein [Candidatus Gracilibacteria bacterium]
MNKVIAHYKTLPLFERTKLNCFELTKDDEKDILKQCENIRIKAIKELKEEKKGFKLLDCRKVITKDFIERQKFEKEQKLPDYLIDKQKKSKKNLNKMK